MHEASAFLTDPCVPGQSSCPTADLALFFCPSFRPVELLKKRATTVPVSAKNKMRVYSFQEYCSAQKCWSGLSGPNFFGVIIFRVRHCGISSQNKAPYSTHPMCSTAAPLHRYIFQTKTRSTHNWENPAGKQPSSTTTYATKRFHYTQISTYIYHILYQVYI